MASSVHGVWGIDIGINSLKAIRLIEGEEGLEVIGFDYIEHGKLLSAEDVTDFEKSEIIAETVKTFVERNEIEQDEVAISVAGHNAFARFIKLPPVEPKKIPEIVRYEAVQQIPFDINEVEWDWQQMENPDSPDTEVGLFAIKNEIVNEIMDVFAHQNLKVTCVQIAPIALHNYVNYDRNDVGTSSKKATVILDMGAENTTLVVSTTSSLWQRSIRIGGNAFTEAIADAFHLRFAKSEKLKRTALRSKYVRQIFSAMKPVYTDLGSELQRSLGFYTSSGSGHQKGFSKIIVFGGGMKLKGVAKYLQQTLGVPVIVPDSFEKLTISEDISSAKFHENITDYGVAYGLAVQLMGEAKVTSNLLPRRIAREMAWARKGKLFTIAACVLLVVSVLSFATARVNVSSYNSGKTFRAETNRIVNRAKDAQNILAEQIARNNDSEAKIAKQMAYFEYRDMIPMLAQRILACLPNKENNILQANLYEAFAGGDVESVMAIPRNQRKQLFVTSMSIHFAKELKTATFKTAKRDGSRNIRKRTTRSYSSDYEDDEEEYVDYGTLKQPSTFINDMPGTETEMETEVDVLEGAGFVVTVEGYSPYAEIGELLDPLGVRDEKSKWGFVTRLKNLEDMFENCPFKLFAKTEGIEHFNQKIGKVEITHPEMPLGIGVVKELTRIILDPEENPRTTAQSTSYAYRGRTGTGRIGETEMGLIDPFTKEEIAKTIDYITQEEIDNGTTANQDDLGKIKYDDGTGEPMYIVRDHWFRIEAKFLWKDAPVQDTLLDQTMQYEEEEY